MKKAMYEKKNHLSLIELLTTAGAETFRFFEAGASVD